MKPTVDIVIVNWNTGDRLRGCLSSLVPARKDEVFFLRRVVVIDNFSQDRSAEDLAFPDLPLEVIRNRQNRGFAAACNQGAQGSTADYLLFLNPDTVVVEDTLAKSVECMSGPEHERTGILGVQLVDDDGAIARSCARFPTTSCYLAKMVGLNRLFPKMFPDHFYLEWDHRASRYIEQVMGAYFFIRRPVFCAAGGFDERYFLYFEEVDLTRIAYRAGWATYYLATAQCRHAGCASTNQIKATRLFYLWRSRTFYSFKNFALADAILLTSATLLIEPLARLGQGILRGSPGQIRELTEACFLFWKDLPNLLGSKFLRKREAVSAAFGES